MNKYKFFDDNELFDYEFLKYALKHNIDTSTNNDINIKIIIN
jgi:hypothetical protein